MRTICGTILPPSEISGKGEMGEMQMKTNRSANSPMFGRREFLAGAAALAASGGFAVEPQSVPAGCFEMTVINPEVVSGGAGLCVIMRTPSGRTYLFDAANGNDKKSNGKDIIIPWLEKRGITKIDGLILSHYHSDHFGGLLYLLDHFEIGHVFDNSFEPLNAYGNTEVRPPDTHIQG